MAIQQSNVYKFYNRNRFVKRVSAKTIQQAIPKTTMNLLNAIVADSDYAYDKNDCGMYIKLYDPRNSDVISMELFYDDMSAASKKILSIFKGAKDIRDIDFDLLKLEQIEHLIADDVVDTLDAGLVEVAVDVIRFSVVFSPSSLQLKLCS